MIRKELHENKLQMDYSLNSTSFEDTSRRAISIARDSHIRKNFIVFADSFLEIAVEFENAYPQCSSYL